MRRSTARCSFRVNAQQNISARSDGGGGIRTLGRGVAPTTVFETAPFNHSGTPPRRATGALSRIGDRTTLLRGRLGWEDSRHARREAGRACQSAAAIRTAYRRGPTSHRPTSSPRSRSTAGSSAGSTWPPSSLRRPAAMGCSRCATSSSPASGRCRSPARRRPGRRTSPSTTPTRRRRARPSSVATWRWARSRSSTRAGWRSSSTRPGRSSGSGRLRATRAPSSSASRARLVGASWPAAIPRRPRPSTPASSAGARGPRRSAAAATRRSTGRAGRSPASWGWTTAGPTRPRRTG